MDDLWVTRMAALADAWETLAEKLEASSVEISDVTMGEVLRLRSCASDLRDMCNALRGGARSQGE